MARIAVISHEPEWPTNGAVDALSEAGADVHEWCMPVKRCAPRVRDHDGVVVLGGTMRMTDVSEHPWLASEVDYLASLLVNNVPVLGICLGGQMLCQIAGGGLEVAKHNERGWVRMICVTPDPLTRDLPRDGFIGYTMHEDGMVPPLGSREIIIGGTCVQGARLPGGRAWALTFHPDITSELAFGWHPFVRRQLADIGRSVAQQDAHFLASYAASQRYSARIFANFATVCDTVVTEVEGEGGVGERLAIVGPHSKA